MSRKLSALFFFTLLCLSGLALPSTISAGERGPEEIQKVHQVSLADELEAAAGNANRYAICQPRLQLPLGSGRSGNSDDRILPVKILFQNSTHHSFQVELDSAELERWNLALQISHAASILMLDGVGYQRLKDTADS